MPRGQSRLSDCSGDEIGEEGLQELELARLERQLRVMEGEKLTYAENSCNLIRKQEAEVAALEQENRDIRTILRLAQSDKNEKMDTHDTERLQGLFQKLDLYNKQAEEEVEQIKALDNEINDMEQQIQHQRKISGGKGGIAQNTEMAIQKRVRVLENRLDKAMIKFNNQLAINAQLRQEIDQYRQERGVFDGLHRKLTRELDSTKQEMNDVIAEASQAYEERDEAQTKMIALKERSEKDQSQHEQEMKDLQRIINHDNKLKEFMSVKASDRADYKEQENAKKRILCGGDKDSEAEHKQIRTYEEAFNKIKKATGKDDIDKIVSDFIQKENENFALFSYINELNDEVERLQDDIVVMHEDHETFQKEDINMQDERRQMLKEMEMRSDIATMEAEKAEKQNTEICKVLDQLRSGVGGLFNDCGCDPSTIDDMLGSEDSVTNKNILQYMGIIEQKTMELLQVQHYIQLKNRPPVKEKKGSKEQQAAPTTQHTKRIDLVPPINIFAPNTGDDEEETTESLEEIEFRPLTRDELKTVVMRNISRRSAGPSTQQMGQSGGKEVKKVTPRSNTRSAN